MEFDIYSFGVISSSKLYLLRDKFPQADCYSEIKEVHTMVGGEATNSSIVLSKLGLKVKIDGNWLGENADSAFVKRLLDSYDIDTSRVTVKKDGYEGVQEIVFADGKTRTIFGTYVQLQEGKQWNYPSKEDISKSKIVCLDPFFQDASIEAARI